LCITLDVRSVAAVKPRGALLVLRLVVCAMRYGSGIIRMKAETIIGAFLSGGGGAKDLTLVALKSRDPRLKVACMVWISVGRLSSVLL